MYLSWTFTLLHIYPGGYLPLGDTYRMCMLSRVNEMARVNHISHVISGTETVFDFVLGPLCTLPLCDGPETKLIKTTYEGVSTYNQAIWYYLHVKVSKM